jgi:hypothetical protein
MLGLEQREDRVFVFLIVATDAGVTPFLLMGACLSASAAASFCSALLRTTVVFSFSAAWSGASNPSERTAASHAARYPLIVSNIRIPQIPFVLKPISVDRAALPAQTIIN